MKIVDSVRDLEQKILSCWSVTDELDVVASAVEDGDKDEILNMLIGLKAIYSRKFEILFNTYEQALKELAHQAQQERTLKAEVNAVKRVEPFGY